MSEPLASRLRPQRFEDFVGQSHVRHTLENKKLHSMIFWGPPGSGKTTLGHLIAQHSHAEFIALSAVMAGVKDLREVIAQAKIIKKNTGQDTVVFIDEIHRFNKSQQDALLPFVEDGTIFLIGATTENPSFEVNNALLSRCRVYALKALTENDLTLILNNALTHSESGLNAIAGWFNEEAKNMLILAADGDARRLLLLLDILSDEQLMIASSDALIVHLKKIIQHGYRQFDKQGEHFYDQISALHKSVRGSSPDAALYWMCRMLDGGCDPLYIARRVIRMASEDIGNADPRALTMALDAWHTLEQLGQPEGELTLAQAVIYMACAPKSNAVYSAYKAAKEAVSKSPSYPVPLHLRNAPTALMKKMNYGKTYRYDHDEPNAFAKGQTYFPEEMGEKIYYHPVSRGLEIKIKEKLALLREEK